jgi:hypothetical protein
MAQALANLLLQAISGEWGCLQAITESEAGTSLIAGRWTRKEELGHLIDSAANNHMRFVRAALDESYDGPGYAQNDWVDLHGYRDLSWVTLTEFWRRYNDLLAHVVARIPDDRLNAPCRIGGGDPVTLGFVIEDYIRHLHHHLTQITGRPPAS